jgi:aminoglycoside 3-N-acetyltransferase I
MKYPIENFQIKRLDKNDVLLFQKLILLFQEVFEMESSAIPNDSYIERLLAENDFICYVAVLDNEIAGGLTAYQLPLYYSESSEIFIYDIAIKQEFQRQGLGKKLISVLKEYSKENGIKELFVAANIEDEYALDFYHSTGAKAEQVVHFSY